MKELQVGYGNGGWVTSDSVGLPLLDGEQILVGAGWNWTLLPIIHPTPLLQVDMVWVAGPVSRCGYQLFRHTADGKLLGAVIDIPIRTALVCDVFVLALHDVTRSFFNYILCLGR